MKKLEIKNLFKYYDKNCVVRDCSITVDDKKILTILGPSGSGKSTLISCIAGIELPQSGVITLNDNVLFDNNSKINLAPEKRNIGFVFQNYALWPHMTIEKHLSFPLKAKKMGKNLIKEKCEIIINMLRLEDKIYKYPHQLSGGEQQRVALGRALIKEPDLLLLDEPLSNLDALLRERMQVEIRHIQKELGVTTILVTHDQEEAKKISDQVAVMNHGIIEQIGSFDSLVDNPQTSFIEEFIKR